MMMMGMQGGVENKPNQSMQYMCACIGEGVGSKWTILDG